MNFFEQRGFAAQKAREAMSWPSAEARPEDVFLAWLLGLPDHADIAAEARLEIARLDGAAGLPPAALRLRELMLEVIEAG